MLPATGFVSVAWAVSCLILTASAAVEDQTECCKCKTLKPSNVPSGARPQTLPSPFKIDINKKSYGADGEIIVTLRATQGRMFRSFILGAYVEGWRPDDKVKGKMDLLPDQGSSYRVLPDCQETVRVGEGRFETFNALISADREPKTMLKFSWKPKIYHGHIEFRATFVENDLQYWVSEKSRILRDSRFPTGDDDDMAEYVPPIDTTSCGKTKGCFREPSGCVEAQCLYILTWSTSSNQITFELGGLADGSRDRYVAFGVSDDTYMGDDTVFSCADDTSRGENGGAGVYVSYNTADPKKNIPVPEYSSQNKRSFISSEQATYRNSRLRCRFTVSRDLDGKDVLPLTLSGGPKHLLFARGFAVKGAPERHGLSVEELPLATADRVDFNSNRDYSGRATYSLAKAHGCLMILAWVFFASIGLLLTKYYKPMWPNKRIFEQRYWFMGHFNFMAAVFIITIIALILIFVEAGGYSEAPDLPQRAHPILGIIIFICIIINPVLALIRPSEDHKCRPVFNWFHWAFGTIANVLAIPQIFIGMDFGKVMVPWWATWILVIWVIFHIIVELTLEIHQCCTHKKNKERRKKWEQLKREYPKQHHPEPEPAGRRFKCCMLSLHVGFTALITLIMIIIIAVSET